MSIAHHSWTIRSVPSSEMAGGGAGRGQGSIRKFYHAFNLSLFIAFLLESSMNNSFSSL